MAQNIKAGNAYVRVDADLNPLKKSLAQIDDVFKSAGARISKIGAGLAGIGAGASAIGASALGSITALSQRFAGLGDELSKARDRTGIAASSLSELGYAAAQSGSDLATVEKSVAKMQKGITEATAGSKTMAEAFASIGLSAADLARLSPEQQFLAVGKAIGAIPGPTARAAKAMQIFGKSGTQLLPLLISDIEALRQEARDLGVVISDQDATNATNLGDAFDRVKKSLGGIATQLGAAIAVPFANIANTIASIIGRVSQWVAANRSVVQTVAAVAAGLVAAGGIATGVGIAIIGLGATIASIGTIASAAFAAVGTAIGILTSPITLAVAGIAAVGFIALRATDSLTVLSEMFGSLGTTATTAWQGIVAAISSGDLETAGQIAFTALEVAWLTVTTSIQEVWARVADFFKNVWLDVVQSIVDLGANIYFGIASQFDKLSTALINGFDTAFVYIIGAIDGIQTAIAKAVIQAQEFFGLFSADQSIQIQQSLDDDLQRRSQGRDRSLGQRSGERAAGAASRDTDRRQTAEDFGRIIAEDFDRRRSTTTVDRSGITAAQSRLAELQGKLQSQSSAAVAKVAEAQQQTEKVKQADLAQQSAASALESTSAGSVGTFVSGVARQIVGGGSSKLEDLGQEQLGMLKSIDERLRESNQEGVLV